MALKPTMRATTLALVLTLTSPLLAIPLPLSHSVPYLDPENRALSSASRPSPHLLPPAPPLPIDAPHPPFAPRFPHLPSLPSLPTWPDSRWAALRRGARKGCRDGSLAADNFIPKEFRPPLNYASSFQPGGSEIGSETDLERSWGVTRWRLQVGYPWIRNESLLGGGTLEWVFWVLTACLHVLLGLELVPLIQPSQTSETDIEMEEGKCPCGDRGEVLEFCDEKGGVQSEVHRGLEDEDTDVDSHLDENGMERSSW